MPNAGPKEGEGAGAAAAAAGGAPNTEDVTGAAITGPVAVVPAARDSARSKSGTGEATSKRQLSRDVERSAQPWGVAISGRAGRCYE